MATETITRVLDDIDGSADAESHTFALDGKTYDIDLSADNFAKLQAALEDYVKVARKSGQPKPLTKRGNDKARLDAIREWANKHGYEVSNRGRIASHIVAEYDAAN